MASGYVNARIRGRIEDEPRRNRWSGADVESIHEVLEKQEARDDEDEADEEEPVVAIATTKGDERLEPIEARVVPIQSTEFVCKHCFLVKHRSQLADKRRMFCRDCA